MMRIEKVIWWNDIATTSHICIRKDLIEFFRFDNNNNDGSDIDDGDTYIYNLAIPKICISRFFRSHI